ncbi:hypothetical protein EPI10_031183 [Gossypium australe]|uniref:Uncharacterized protein n=1 Tax=Gossypium australe TaxID=47621 RepID=A0A5B6X0U3_9ROSI|nr:hypothetical protein EPI10_031183 [Gossypium australe]
MEAEKIDNSLAELIDTKLQFNFKIDKDEISQHKNDRKIAFKSYKTQVVERQGNNKKWKK